MKYLAEPVPLRREDYTRFIDRYLERVKTLPQVKAVYQYGNTDYDPGISDVDLLLILEGPMTRELREKIRMRNVPHPAPVLTRNEVTPLTLNLFEENILKVHEQKMELLHGRPYRQRAMTSSERKAHLLAHTLDWVGSTLLSLAMRRRSGEVRILPTLGILLHITHDLRMFKEVTGEGIEGDEKYIGEIHALRRNWFTRGEEKYRTLHQLMREGEKLASAVSFRIQEKLSAWGCFRENPKFLRVLTAEEGFHLVFASSSYKKVLEENGLMKKEGIILPSVMYAQLAFYLEVNRPIRKMLSNRLGAKHDLWAKHDLEASSMILGDYRFYLQKRIESIWKYFAFVRENRLLPKVSLGMWWVRIGTGADGASLFSRGKAFLQNRIRSRKAIREAATQRVQKEFSLDHFAHRLLSFAERIHGSHQRGS